MSTPTASRRRSLWQDTSLSTITAGLVAVTIGYTSSAAIIFQAAAAAGASAAQISSWLWALGIGMGLTSLALSLYYRMPLLTAWSTPGAAFLATSLPGVPMAEAIGAFMFSALLITLCGVTGLFERLMRFIPAAIAQALLAGILLRFGLELFAVMQTQWLLPLAMLGAWLVGRRLWPTMAVPGVLVAGVAVALALGQVAFDEIPLAPALPVFTLPAFVPTTLIGIGIPLFIITMATQNLPGVAVLRAAGYQPPTSALIGWTGAATGLLAPFGGFALNTAAISAAVCVGPDAHADMQRRYAAGVAAGVFYIVMGIFGASVTGLFNALPDALVTALAGIALLGTLAGGLAGAFADPRERDAAIVTFLLTGANVTLLGIGSAFWGLVAGLITLRLTRRG
ncbi:MULTISPECIES: benzoate/H(+) symporter BenE family transporter [unclassified Halomonas]|uniref:benzoate/H(+) symporter BenE family transporter n=1 Tax=unclassified Halomonas TaxID=2609666 RepID=UPI00209D5AE7|nr:MULTISPECIES: benzoate/H(+) symporter BenE family transporter [unclassified Halomonas]MCP1315026.1 benzoate/H(+) symporter BenE family transporter [Halomonas sp. 707D7]MCP1325603.1 benzoate/H(+) symporter BenE family transporter [Halomonas sp. 707D4]